MQDENARVHNHFSGGAWWLSQYCILIAHHNSEISNFLETFDIDNAVILSLFLL